MERALACSLLRWRPSDAQSTMPMISRLRVSHYRRSGTHWHVAREGRRLPVVAPARPMSPARDRHEMRANVDVDVVHVGVRHGATIAVVSDQPFDDLPLAAICIEIDGIATGVFGGMAATGDGGAGSAGGHKLDGTEFLLDAFEQCTGRWC